MLFESLALKKINVAELMNTELLKVPKNIEIKQLIKEADKSNSEVIIVLENEETDEIAGIISTLDIIKILETNLTLEEYIVKNDRRMKFTIEGSAMIEKAVEMMMKNNIDKIPVSVEDTVVGVISSHKLLAQSNSSFCK